jgi:ribosomal protein S18 acetylase RimI-like enzyme
MKQNSMTKEDSGSIQRDSEIYCDSLRELAQIASNGNKYSFKVGVNKELAEAWSAKISNDPEVKKWTADFKKRATSEEILARNKPGEPKNVVTYSLWSTDGKLAAVSWYQIWDPGEAEMEKITEYCQAKGIDNPLILTIAFRVAADFRKQGLAKQMITLTETAYAAYLAQKNDTAAPILFTLETDQGNLVAVHTYETRGYTTIGEFDQPDKESYRGKRLLMVKRHK